MKSEPSVPDEAEALAAALARTRKSYDDTPYVSSAFMRLQPGRMAAAARWFGLDAPDARSARVLEIGCASGGHLIPLAAATPQSHFVGVDLSSVQIEQGQTRIERLGLANIELSARSLSDIAAADGEFDFIVCHGVYSWIPEPVRADLIRVISERLSPDGVAVVSFNVLPGWRLFQLARDSLLLHARLQDDPARRAEQAQDLFARMARESVEGRTYGRFWREEALRMAAGGDAYIAHEIFEDSNSPVTYSDFCAALDQRGLAYLGESVVSANSEQTLAPAGADSIREFARGDDRAREQYIDIFSGRAFREALIVRAARAGAIRREPLVDRLADFHFVAPLDLTVKPMEGEEGAWVVADADQGVVLRDVRVAQAMQRLVDRLPRSSRLEDILAPEGNDPDALHGVADTLAQLVQFGQCAISTLPVVCADRLAERPRASRLAAVDALHGDATASLRHASVRLNPLQRLFLPLLDGTRTRDDLVARALELAEQGVLNISGPDGPVEGRENFLERLRPATDHCLESLLRLGLLEAE
jgi:SAM-dependent methyltransferase